MAIKISNINVIDNTRKGIFQSVGLGTYTSATRPSIPIEGDIIYNTTLNVPEFWDGTSWIPLV
jgi:hypothetical protein